jgi:hypothetical protein
MKARTKLGTPWVTVLLFLLAAALLLGSSVGGVRAALTYYSETYASRLQMYDIGVTLNENGDPVSWRDYRSAADGTWNETTGVLLANLLEEGESLKLGKAYPEAISVTNSGTIDQYVRVRIYRYWLDADGNKLQNLSPDLIDLDLLCDATGSDSGWLLDDTASTPERTVLYYDRILPVGDTTPALSDTLRVDGMVASKVTTIETTQDGYTTILTTYDYDGVRFQLEAQVDAVQTHNAQDAILSAWGRRVTITDGTLQLQ